MFEGFAGDLLNKFFGDYFENLDTSNLNVSLWRGDVSLKDLIIKTTALDFLKLPLQVVSGKVGALTLRIPWITIYTSPVELTLTDLLMVVVPQGPTPYNAEEEAQAELALKMKILGEIEEARQASQLREAGEEGNSFKEKLAMHIVRNVQIRIDSLHVRYEDNITSPGNPFTIGIVLKSLNVETTDKDWQPNFVTIPIPTFFKKINLNGLALYMSSGEMNMMSQKLKRKESMITQLKTMLVKEELLQHKYMAGPIMTELKLQLTPSPESLSPSPFSLPKVTIEVLMNELALGISNVQFRDILHFADGLHFLTKAKKWRKFRPNVGKKGNARIWWKFILDCILVQIRRRRENWDWNKIQSHRRLVSAYYDACYKKEIENDISPPLLAKIEEIEKELDNFNIILVRKQVELKKDRAVRIENERRRHSGWLGSLLGWDMGETVDVGKMDDRWNDEERRKLEAAIGYSTNVSPAHYPREYVELKLDFCMKKLVVTVKEYHEGSRPGSSIILLLNLDDFVNRLEYRPVRNSLKLEWKMGDIEVLGLNSSTRVLKTRKGLNEKLFEITYEVRPLNSTAERRIQLKTKAVDVIYHAETLSQFLTSFSPPREVLFSRIQREAIDRLNGFKELSQASLKRMIRHKGELIVEIDFTAPCFIIPQAGNLDIQGSVLIIDLGLLQVRTQTPEVKTSAPPSALPSEPHENGLTPEFLDHYYETYSVQLKDFRVLLALDKEEYNFTLTNTSGFSRKGNPTLLRLQEVLLMVNHSLLVSNPIAPKFFAKISLHVAELNIAEDRLIQLMKLLMPLPVLRKQIRRIASNWSVYNYFEANYSI